MKIINICVPTIDNKIHVKCMTSILGTIDILRANNFMPILSIKQGSHINRLRNEFLADFYHNKYDYLFFVDSDVSGFENGILKLINSNKKIIGIPYGVKQFDEALIEVNNTLDSSFYFNLNKKQSFIEMEKELKKNNNIMEVDNIATGCLLIKKKLINEMILKYKNRKYNDNYRQYPLYNLFDSFINEGIYLTEDYGFCHLVSRMNIKIYAECSTNLTHWGEIKYSGNFLTFIKKIKLKYKNLFE